MLSPNWTRIERIIHQAVLPSNNNNNNNNNNEDREIDSVVKSKIGSRGYLLHHACASNNASCNLIKLLLQYNPQALYEKSDENGWYPIHYACANSDDESGEIVQLLLSEYPDLIMLRTDRIRDYPLHVACQYHRSA